MDSRPPDSGPSPYSALPDPCDRCKQTICFFLHSDSASTCPYNLCSECQELEALDAQIMDLHHRLINLSNKRHELKGRINRRHDQFTSYLPIELISDIFALVVHGTNDRPLKENNQDHRWNPLLALGAVCRQWRDITLGTPTLWTKISIFPRKDNTFDDFTDQWLSRSGTLPLILEIYSSAREYHLGEPTPNLLCPNTVQLLRSHAYRWKGLNLQGTPAMLPMVLAELEDKLVVDSLRIGIYYTFGGPKVNTITMKYPFVPKRLDIYNVPLPSIPLQWERLTYFKAASNAVDGLLHIIHHAHSLEHCILHSVQEDEGHYPISTTPVTNASVKELDVYVGLGTANLLRHLTFPSLEILRYSKSEGQGDDEDITALSEFLHRSQPPLHHFFFCHDFPTSSAYISWFRILTSITSLELDMTLGDKEIMQICLDSLGPHVEPMALPRLRDLKLKIGTTNMSPHWWNTLIKVIPDRKINKDTTPMFSRPLKTVTVTIQVTWDPSWEMAKIDDVSYSRLRAVQDSGVELKVLNELGIDISEPNFKLTQ